MTRRHGGLTSGRADLLVAAMCAVWVLAALRLADVELPKFRVDWQIAAAWVQALLSAAAILIAGKFSYREHLLQRCRTLDSIEGIAASVEEVAEEAYASARRAYETGSLLLYAGDHRFDRALELLRSVPHLEIGDIHVVQMLIDLEGLIEEAKVHNRGAVEVARAARTDWILQRLEESHFSIAAVRWQITEFNRSLHSRARRWWLL